MEDPKEQDISIPKRPSWVEYYMAQVELISTRSPDPNTKHGCIITDRNFAPISQGYNGYPKKIKHDPIFFKRPFKYLITLHAEHNAILFARRDLTGCFAFVTGIPCSRCLSLMVQVGISRCYYGDRKSACVDGTDATIRDILVPGYIDLIYAGSNGNERYWKMSK